MTQTPATLRAYGVNSSLHYGHKSLGTNATYISSDALRMMSTACTMYGGIEDCSIRDK